MSSSAVARGAGAQLDDGEHGLAHVGVGDADHRDVGDRGMGGEHALDLGGVDVGAAGDDQVGAAVGDEEVAVVVELAEVAGGEDAVAKRGARLLLGAAIAERPCAGRARRSGRPRPRGSARPVVVEDVDLVPRPRRADAARLAQPFLGADAGEAALRGAVELGDRAGREHLHDAALHVPPDTARRSA